MDKAKIKAAATQSQDYLGAAQEELPTPAAGVYALMSIATSLAALLEHVADEEL